MAINKQVNKDTSKLIRIDTGWHKILKVLAAERETSIKGLVEASLAEYLYGLEGQKSEIGK